VKRKRFSTMSNALTVWQRFLNARGITETPVVARENEWVRVYRVSSGLEFKDSKFLTGEAEFTADSVKQRWSGLSFEDKLEFTQAYIVKPNLSGEDQRIIDYLLDVADDNLAIVIAHLLPKFNNRDKALEFIKERITGKLESPLAGYFDALARMKDSALLPTLKSSLQKYRDAGKKLTSTGRLNFLYCCYALWKIEETPVYKLSIEDLLTSDDDAVRLNAQRILNEKTNESG
jgi:hypothetical protein